MKKIVRFLILLTILSLSCNFLTGGPAFGEVSGPILGVLTAAALDDQGELVDPAYSFAPTAAQVTVVVQVGALDSPAPLSVTWYRVSDQGDEKLFEHTIQVDTFDLGYSVGLNPDLLASGTYKAVAALGEGTQTVTWIVAEEQAQPGVESPANASAAPAQEGEPPASGASGKIPLSQRASGATPPAGGTLPAGCESDALLWEFPPIVNGGAFIRGVSAVNEINPCASLGELEVVVSIGDNSPRTGCSFQAAMGSCTFTGDPCSLDGGSDLPFITKVNANLRKKQTGQVFAQQSLVLGADTYGPVVTFGQNTDPAKKVKEGDKIKLTVTAKEVEGASSWQTGIQEIQMTGPVYAPDGAWNNPSPMAKACEAKTWSSPPVKFTYEVPPNPPAEIKLCVLAKDYADNYNERDDCIIYHTGDQLKGKLNRNHRFDTDAELSSTTVWQEDADLSLNLEPDGTLTGTAQITNFSFHGEGTTKCGPYSDSYDPIQLTLPVNGEWTEDAIIFRFTTDAPIMTTQTFTECDFNYTGQVDVTAMVLQIDYHAAWDGQAYTADETINNSGAGWTSEDHWTIHLEPPALGVGLSPGPWAAASGGQASVDLTYP